jgi:hypothetical protein
MQDNCTPFTPTAPLFISSAGGGNAWRLSFIAGN